MAIEIEEVNQSLVMGQEGFKVNPATRELTTFSGTYRLSVRETLAATILARFPCRTIPTEDLSDAAIRDIRELRRIIPSEDPVRIITEQGRGIKLVLPRADGLVEEIDDLYEYGHLSLRDRTRKITCDGRLVSVSLFQARALKMLIYHEGDLLRRAEMIEAWCLESYAEDNNAIAICMPRLRKQVNKVQEGREDKITIEGISGGYRLSPKFEPKITFGAVVTSPFMPTAL